MSLERIWHWLAFIMCIPIAILIAIPALILVLVCSPAIAANYIANHGFPWERRDDL